MRTSNYTVVSSKIRFHRFFQIFQSRAYLERVKALFAI